MLTREEIRREAEEAAMSPVAMRLITAEEFALRPDPVDGSKEELVRGEIETMPPTKGRHGLVQGLTYWLLQNFVKPNRLGWVVVESGVVLDRDPDTVRGPDVSFYSLGRHPQPPEDYFEIPPDLAAEVLSPDDRPGRVRDKIAQYLASGVKLVWLVDPETQSVTVYAGTLPGHKLSDTDTLDGGDVLPGFTARIADFFA
jgi:Uma2 family endonuclease